MKILLITVTSLLLAIQALAHCQVPCGIYGDELKFGELKQDVETILKAMASIETLSEECKLSSQDNNQMVRWVTTKEAHAQNIQQQLLDYFLAQRIEPNADNLTEKLVLIHSIIIEAMKCKQTVDQKHATKLSSLIEDFEEMYFADAKHDH